MKTIPPLLSLLLLAACSTPKPEPVQPQLTVVEQPAAIGGQLTYELSVGDYQCEFGHTVDIRRTDADKTLIDLGWNGQRYELKRDPSFSGLPRYENLTDGLVWIELPWKGVLLDGRTQKPLANECRMA